MIYFSFHYLPYSHGGKDHKPSKLIRDFKNFRPDAIKTCTDVLFHLISKYKDDSDSYLVPVPGSSFKINAITFICPELATMLSLKNGSMIITKKFETKSFCVHKQRSSQELIKSLRVSDLIRGKSLILFDDITTTGTTLNSLTQLFLSLGAESVKCFAIAKTIKLI